MNVVVASTFRDSVPYLDRYFEQCQSLLDLAAVRGDKVRFVWGENDSVDDTRARLDAFDGDTTVVDCSTGAPYYRSADTNPARWENVAEYCNATLDAIGDGYDVLVWVESDLVWEPDVILALAEQAEALEAVAAPVWYRGAYYDTFTTRKDGERFSPTLDTGLVRVDSCAGCIAVRADRAAVARYSPDTCASYTRDLGGVWLDTNLVVVQP